MPIFGVNDPDWREQVEEAFKRGISVSLMPRPSNRWELRSAILGLAAKLLELGFLQVYLQVEGVKWYPHGFAARLQMRKAIQSLIYNYIQFIKETVMYCAKSMYQGGRIVCADDADYSSYSDLGLRCLECGE